MWTEENPNPIFITKTLTPLKNDLIALTREYIDVLTWSYEDMPRLDPQVAMHHLIIKKSDKPMKQQ